MLASLGAKSGAAASLFVKAWPGFWKAVAESHPEAPITLSEAGARAALVEAIRLSALKGLRKTPDELVGTPGFRRRLRERFDDWTRRETLHDREWAENLGSEDAFLYHEYRRLLATSGAVDVEGLAVWGSKILESDPAPLPSSIGRPTSFNLLDFDLTAVTPAIHRALAYFEEAADVVRLSLFHDPLPALESVNLPNRGLPERFIERGYVEWPIEEESWRPATLETIERTLFRDDVESLPKIEAVDGLKWLGAPKGEGEALLVAQEIRRLIVDVQVAPEDILVLTRRWNDDADTLTATLNAWGLPVSAHIAGKPLASFPAVSALLLASEIPVDGGWEASKIVELLRHGMVNPESPKGWSKRASARAASAVRDTLVFQGREFLRSALDRACADQAAYPRKLRRAGEARDVVDWLIAQLEVWAQPRVFSAQIDALLVLARTLGLGSVDLLEDALWDQAALLESSGEAERIWTFEEFASELRGLAGDLNCPEPSIAPGSVVVTSLDRAEGARAAFVIHSGLDEGTFPTRDAVESLENSREISPGYAREMLRFLRIFGSADEGVVLSRPTRDDKGQEILPAGFLDDLRRLFRPEMWRSIGEFSDRLDPSFLGTPDLAVGPCDARILAVARASIEHDPSDLARLATEPIHREALLGTALALDLAHRRRFSPYFGLYEGRLQSPKVAKALAKRFAPDVTFSASQLESYLYCRFQFFMNYVLGIEPVNDDDQLMEDAIHRGNELHRFLESLEILNLQDARGRLELVDIVINNEMRAEFVGQSEADAGLQMIEIARTKRQLRTYVRQAIDHDARGMASTPKLFEVGFGRVDSPHPALELGEGADMVRLQGKIDRIDWVETETGTAFRVIDYKTGAIPKLKDVKAFVKLQLPLYALAVERLGIAGGPERLFDLAYWELKDRGFSAVKIDDWPTYRDQLVSVVIEAVKAVRAGGFEISSTDKDCTRFCDFSTACRIKQVRDARKSL